MKTLEPNELESNKDNKEIVGVDLGNSWIRTIHAHKAISFQHTLQIEKDNVYISKKPNPLTLIDLLAFIGHKYQHPSFQEIIKYYHYNLKKGTNKSIVLEASSPFFGDQFYFQLPLTLIIKGIFLTTPALRLLSTNPIKLVSTVFQGKLNPYRLALVECFKMAGINQIFLANANTCIAAQYLVSTRKSRDDIETVGIIDFGAQGMTFSAYKLYHMQTGIIQALFYEITHLGGLTLTHLLTDYLTQQLIKEKGMDINKNAFFMHKLKLLCDQAKHTLSSNEKAFIRLDGLPDIVVYGCEVSLQQFQKCIHKTIQENINTISNILTSKTAQLSKIIVTGGSSKIPLFQRLLSSTVRDIPILYAESDWVTKGLLIAKSDHIRIMDICPFDLRLEGDEQLSAHLVKKGESVPLRKKINLKFPSGQLTFSLKFYQNNELISTCFVPQRPRQNNFALYIQIDHNKLLHIFATTSQGLIKMNVNMMEMPRQEYLKYAQHIHKANFYIQE